MKMNSPRGGASMALATSNQCFLFTPRGIGINKNLNTENQNSLTE